MLPMTPKGIKQSKKNLIDSYNSSPVSPPLIFISGSWQAFSTWSMESPCSRCPSNWGILPRHWAACPAELQLACGNRSKAVVDWQPSPEKVVDAPFQSFLCCQGKLVHKQQPQEPWEDAVSVAPCLPLAGQAAPLWGFQPLFCLVEQLPLMGLVVEISSVPASSLLVSQWCLHRS